MAAVKDSGDQKLIALGAPTLVSLYREQGDLFATTVLRWDVPGDKLIRYCSPFTQPDGKTVWLLQGPTPGTLTNPLGSDQINGKPIMVVEGEKKRERLHALIGHKVTILTWRGGAKNVPGTDWCKLSGQGVIIWADNDTAGTNALYNVAAAATEAKAAKIKVVALPMLAAELGLQDLPQGYDADDLTPDWTGDRLLAFLDKPGSIVDIDDEELQKRIKKKTAKKSKGASAASTSTGTNNQQSASGTRQHELEFAIDLQLKARGYSVDAAGRWLEYGHVADKLSCKTLAKIIVRELRLQGIEVFKAPRVEETLEVLVREWKQERKSKIRERILYQPTDPKGLDELRRWVFAITGACDEVILHVFVHWIWLVKRSLARLDRKHDFMPILFSIPQGPGKSQSVKKLCSPLEELAFDVDYMHLTDDRFKSMLADYVIGIWDEMGGASRAETDKLKNTLTSSNTGYRQLGGHDHVAMYRLTNFIGSSNKPVGDLIRDTTGNRRFVQVDTLTVKFDWDEINRLDYNLIWTCVNEEDAEPILPFLDKLGLHQSAARHHDAVSLWLQDEDWHHFDRPMPDGRTIHVPVYIHATGDSSLELRSRYLRWCHHHGELPTAENSFFARIKEVGFTKRQIGSVRERRYFQPDSMQIQIQPGTFNQLVMPGITTPSALGPASTRPPTPATTAPPTPPGPSLTPLESPQNPPGTGPISVAPASAVPRPSSPPATPPLQPEITATSLVMV